MKRTLVLTALAVPALAWGQAEPIEVFSSDGCSLTVTGTDVVFSGCNVTINNGDGGTGTTNGLGNLVLGDNVTTHDDERSGSHNLVIGDEHTYTARGGLLAGHNHKVRRDGGVAVGGRGNKVTGAWGSVFGGKGGHADDNKSTMVGGHTDLLAETAADLAQAIADIDLALGAIEDLQADNTTQDARLALLSDQVKLNTVAIDTIEADYLTSDDLVGLATTKDLEAYATEAWVGQQGFLHSGDLSGYATRAWTQEWALEQGFLTEAELDGLVTHDELKAFDFATEAWVLGLDLGGGVDGLADYVTVDTANDAVYFTGANVFVQDGSGNTACSTDRGDIVISGSEDPCTGKGNLIVGYNQELTQEPALREGSHNLVVGDFHDYRSYGGVVIGSKNTIEHAYASVLGGLENTASGSISAVLGGFDNIADGARSTVLGGSSETATSSFDVAPMLGDLMDVVTLTDDDVTFEGVNVRITNGTGLTYAASNGLGNLIVGYDQVGSSSVRTGSHNIVLGDLHTYTGAGGFVGGLQNSIEAESAFIASGVDNSVTGQRGFVGTGYQGDVTAPEGVILTGYVNTAGGLESAIVSGAYGETVARGGAILGGSTNEAGEYGSIVGGFDNRVEGFLSVIVGGAENVTGAHYSTIVGGESNLISVTADDGTDDSVSAYSVIVGERDRWIITQARHVLGLGPIEDDVQLLQSYH